jgi:hypothetical protein
MKASLVDVVGNEPVRETNQFADVVRQPAAAQVGDSCEMQAAVRSYTAAVEFHGSWRNLTTRGGAMADPPVV